MHRKWRHLLALPLVLAACGDDPAGGGTGAASTSTSTAASGTGGSGSATGAGGAGGDATGTGGSGQGGSQTGGSHTGGGSSCGATIPEAYDGKAYDTNAAVELDLRKKLDEMQNPMKAAEADIEVVPTKDEILALFAAGNPSLRDVTTEYYVARIESLIKQFVAAAGNEWTPADPPTGTGGILGTHIYDQYGVDLRQSIEKGMFNATFFNHAVAIAKGPLDAAAIDRLVAAFGAHPTFPGNSEEKDPAKVPHPDRLMAQYAERRSPKHPDDSSKPLDPSKPGPYFRMKAALITAQAAIAAGPDCDGERDTAIASFLLDWEKSSFATVIYYLNTAAGKLTLEAPTEADIDSGLHGYGEAIGFVHGMRTVAAPGRVITDAQIDALLETLGAPVGKPATAYKLVTDAASTVPKLQQAIDDIVAIYGFTAEEVETFKINY